MLSDDVVAGLEELALSELLRQRLQKEVPVALPGAGADWTLAVPAGVAWEILAVQETLSTSAVVANRSASIIARNADAKQLWRIANSAVVAASQVASASWLTGLGALINVSHLQAPLPSPPYLLVGGETLASITGNIDVGDVYTAIMVVVREWSIREALLNVEWIKNHAR